MQAHKVAIVLAPFETRRYRLDVPASKQHLLQMIDTGDIEPFRQHEWPQGQAPIDFDRWMKATKPYLVDWQTGM